MTYFRKTKIVCTLGPACEEQLEKMLLAGMNVARLNFSHGDHLEHEKRWKRLNAAIKTTDKRIAIMLDTQGPKVRITCFDGDSMELIEGETVCLVSGSENGGIRNGVKTIVVNYPHLLEVLSHHHQVYFADGMFELKVEKVEGGKAFAKVVTGGKLGNRKGINVPHASWELPSLGPKDVVDVLWGIKHDVDYVAQSFVRTANDVKKLRKLLDKNGGHKIKIVAKIEEYDAVKNFDEILEIADAIMVARGDLGVQAPIEQVPVMQKEIIRKCNAASKPVITATQMLESMTTMPMPTRAEVTDVANAIMDGSDAVMLSGETSAGKHPVKVVQTMVKIIEQTEQKMFNYDRFPEANICVPDKNAIAVCVGSAVCRIASQLGVTAIVAHSEEGNTARYISRYRPQMPIVALTPHEKTARRLCLVWGTTPVLVNKHEKLEDVMLRAGETIQKTGIIKKGDLIVVTAGIPFGAPGSTNMMKVQQV